MAMGTYARVVEINERKYGRDWLARVHDAMRLVVSILPCGVVLVIFLPYPEAGIFAREAEDRGPPAANR